MPTPLVANQKEIKGEPFLGNDDARLQVLLRTNRSSTWP
jgi:hypothetical protein